MIAQTPMLVEIGVVIALFGAMIGTIWRLLAHMQDPHRHVDPEKVVFQDTCNAEKRAIGARQESLEKKVDDLKADMLREFGETRELIRRTNGG